MNNSVILIENYEVTACHGVNSEEKVNPQRFLVSCELYASIASAARTDEIDKTVSYATVCKRIKSFLCEKSYNLLETLAVRLAQTILTEFPLDGIKVTVKKPDAPMKGTFDYVGVSTTLAWHKVYLSLGSNMGDRNAYLDFAVSSLKKDASVKCIKESGRIETAPYGGAANNVFVNSCVELMTLYTPHELLKLLNGIEKEGGRVRDLRWGDRTLDIDIIFYDDLVLEDCDLCIPHIDMQNRVFVLAPLNELCPNKLHPILNKRVCELYSAVSLISK